MHGAVIDSTIALPTLGDVASASSPQSLGPSETTIRWNAMSRSTSVVQKPRPRTVLLGS